MNQANNFYTVVHKGTGIKWIVPEVDCKGVLYEDVMHHQYARGLVYGTMWVELAIEGNPPVKFGPDDWHNLWSYYANYPN